MGLSCKRCGSTSFIKNGFVRALQRYRCQTCGWNFTATPQRGHPETIRALAVVLYSIGKVSYRRLGELLGVSHVSAYKWVCQAMAGWPEPKARAEIKEMNLNELWYFLRSKGLSAGSGKPFIVTHGVLAPGSWGAVIMLSSGESGDKSRAPAASMTPME
jgi:transposase